MNGLRQSILPGLSSEDSGGSGACETGEQLDRLHTGGQEVTEGWFSAVEEVTYTPSSGDTGAWYPATEAARVLRKANPQLLGDSDFLTACCLVLYKLRHAVLTPDLN